MPGRQSTGPPLVKKSKAKKRKQSSSLNALAIAEQQHPTKTKVRQHRLGAPESDSAGRKRPLEVEDAEQEHDSRQSKRPRAGDKDRFGNEVEGGSDSEGNEWVLGAVDEDDDSDLDSDEAMGESDEERFESFTFRGSSSTGIKKSGKKPSTEEKLEIGVHAEIDLDEIENDPDTAEESDGLGDDAIDLADAMDDNSSEGQLSESESGDDPGQHPIPDDSDHEDVVDPKKLALLGDFVSSMNDPGQTPSRRQTHSDAHETMTPSEFGVTSKEKLTLADLKSSITDPNLRNSLKLLADDSKPSSKRGGVPRKLEVPLAKRQQDRLDRAAAYAKSKETLNQWIDTVKHNRRAEHLSFPLKDHHDVVAQGSQRLLPTVNSKPVTELEAEINSILHRSGLGPATWNDDEDVADTFTELSANKLSVEEVANKRAELRRARDHLFREEKRAKRIKKIKSKTYRKVHRKEREKVARSEKDAMVAAGVEDSESEQERNDRRRAEERMGQRHRESRWAKSVKDTGRAAWDEDARGGVTEMARRGEELRKRMEGKSINNEGSGTSDSESDDDEKDVEDTEGRSLFKALNRIREVNEDGNDGSYAGLSSMPFMRKAESIRREQNDAAVEHIRRDLEGEDSRSDEEPNEAGARRSYGPQQQKPPKEPPTQRSEFEEQPASDEDEIRFDDDADQEIILDTAKSTRKSNAKQPTISRPHHERQQKPSKKPPSTADENPWLITTTTHRQKKDRKPDDRAEAIITNLPSPEPTAPFVPSTHPPKPRSALKGSRAAASTTSKPTTTTITPAPPGSPHDSDSDFESSTPAPHPLLPTTTTNAALIDRAFAGDSVTASFLTEKAHTTATEAPQQTSTYLPGWGSWTGMGVRSSSHHPPSHHSSSSHHPSRHLTTTTTPGLPPHTRKDAQRGLEKTIINEKRVKKNSKYLASSLPHPFETRAQYERALRLPVGPEWATKETVQGMTRPRVVVRRGEVVGAMGRVVV